MKSLKQLAESKTAGIQKATYFKVDPNILEFEEGFNLRDETESLDAHIAMLASAMEAGAYVPPIDVMVADGRIIVRDGHCRTQAARRLIAKGLPYQLEARQIRGNDADAVLHMLGAAAGKELSPLERGRGYLRLIRYGLSVAQIAARTGMSRTTIENGLALAEAPQQVQQMIASGAVASHTALQTVRQHGAEAPQRLADAATKGNGKVKPRDVSYSPKASRAELISLLREIVEASNTLDEVLFEEWLARARALLP